MYEVLEEPQGSPPLPAGGQTEISGSLRVALRTIRLFRVPDASIGSREPTTGDRAGRFSNGPTLVTRTSPLYSDLARSRPAIIAWPASLSGNNPARYDSIKGLCMRPHHRTLIRAQLVPEILMAEIGAAMWQRSSNLPGR
ncbi:hypothetical protein RF11_00060 [Thelohanellus kitauei]|uniref:Uncharacterized protein n=1 Tax=Thelohanellus kitauei TaxID=669202 RepID=A0A0C2J8C8_THEKT|nr:hypothetical protein RF11_00060 [Thelohanellus kitauei]